MDWLISVLRMFADFIPRPVLVTPDQRIVIFLLGKWPIVGGPFIYMGWPMFWHHEIVQVSESVAESQIVIKGEKRRIEIVYQIFDPLKSIVVPTDAEDRTVAETNGHLCENNGQLDSKALNQSCAEWGVIVKEVYTVADGILTIDVNG